MTRSPLDRRELWESTAIPDGSRLTTVHPGCSGVVVAGGEGVAVLRWEVLVGLGAVRVGLGVVVATLLWGAATGEEDEHAADGSPGHPESEHDTDHAMTRRAASMQPFREVLSGHGHADLPPMQLQATRGHSAPRGRPQVTAFTARFWCVWPCLLLSPGVSRFPLAWFEVFWHGLAVFRDGEVLPAAAAYCRSSAGVRGVRAGGGAVAGSGMRALARSSAVRGPVRAWPGNRRGTAVRAARLERGARVDADPGNAKPWLPHPWP